VTEGQEALRGKVPVRELGAEEHGSKGGQIESPQNQRLLPFGVEAQLGQVAKDERQPRPPDEKLDEHHHRQSDARPVGAASLCQPTAHSWSPPGSPR